jgi:hypothetical protein
MQTQATFRYTSDAEGEPIPARSVDGTITAYLADVDSVTVEIYAPQPVNKGVITLTIEQLRGLISEAMKIEAIAEKNRKDS